MRLQDKKIILGITGSIAAYKTPHLVMYLVKEGAHVEVIMTDAARDFVTPLTLSTVSDHPVHWKPFNSDDGSWDSHVDMGTSADLLLIAPVSANTLAKMAAGQADNLLLTTYLAATCPVMFAPAMDLDMYKHPFTQRNIETLQKQGNHLISPQEGELASGLTGCGRMEEPEHIVEKVVDFFLTSKRFLGKRVLVTAGPTYENIDPVRFLGNYSSGKMGVALAEQFAAEGAQVLLVAGPGTPETTHPSIERSPVTTAASMYDEVLAHYSNSDIVVMAAAVADFTIEKAAPEKIKKSGEGMTLRLVPTKDILKTLGESKEHQFLVGFALETENAEKHARAKLKNKNADLIVLNEADATKGSGCGVDTNKIKIFDAGGSQQNYAVKPKQQVARDIVNYIAEQVTIR
jgi:phosphopantothenoylcysteine decarboxylase/phosphopantothenate--cysteine ligase